MPKVCADLIAIFQALRLSSLNLVGYSMGGRLALYTAVNHSRLLHSLILESSSPGLESVRQRQERRASDEILAGEILQHGIVPFIDKWQRLPLFTSQKNLDEEKQKRLRQQRLDNHPLGLANSLRGLGTGRQPSLWPQLASLRIPALIMAGEYDTKYVAVSRRIAAKIQSSRLEIVPSTGHNIHLEKPYSFMYLLNDFLDRLQ
jgi:2-succinyl-6-hydroxy-2,4-cyclohexadiene-1-carboxylate synthase